MCFVCCYAVSYVTFIFRAFLCKSIVFFLYPSYWNETFLNNTSLLYLIRDLHCKIRVSRRDINIHIFTRVAILYLDNPTMRLFGNPNWFSTDRSHFFFKLEIHPSSWLCVCVRGFICFRYDFSYLFSIFLNGKNLTMC